MRITTERLALEPISLDYLESTYAYASDLETTRFMCFYPHDSIEETRAFIESAVEEWGKARPGRCEFVVLAEGLKDLPVKMNPWDKEKSMPNFWLSCMTIDEDALAPMEKGRLDYLYKSKPGKSSPLEILDAMAAFNAEGRPIWKPMHMQPIYLDHEFISSEGVSKGRSFTYDGQGCKDVGADIFRRGLCLPSDNKMTAEQQDKVIEIIHRCFL